MEKEKKNTGDTIFYSFVSFLMLIAISVLPVIGTLYFWYMMHKTVKQVMKAKSVKFTVIYLIITILLNIMIISFALSMKNNKVLIFLVIHYIIGVIFTMYLFTHNIKKSRKHNIENYICGELYYYDKVTQSENGFRKIESEASRITKKKLKEVERQE